MIVYQYLSNIAYIAALTLPYLFIRNGLDDKQVYYDFVVSYLQFINIFFITGIIYLALALAKNGNFPLSDMRLPVCCSPQPLRFYTENL